MPNKVALYSRRSTCCRTVLRSEQDVLDTFRLRCMLMKSAVERLTAVRHVMSRDYGSPSCQHASLQRATTRQRTPASVACINDVYICVNRMSIVYLLLLR